MRARRLQRPNRGPQARRFCAIGVGTGSKDLLFLGGKHKVSQGYSLADENAGLAYALRDDVL